MKSPRAASGVELHVEELTHVYSLGASADVNALDDINLVLPAGTTAAVIGPSGSGKSTLMTLLAGLHRPTTGRILISNGTSEIDIAALNERELLRVRAEQVSLVVQNPSRNLVPWGDAEDNIRFAQLGPRGYHPRRLPDP
jgi:putative ABC transport system ATP-binding protein